MKKKVQKTITVGDDSPMYSLAKGRLTPTAFKKALKSEGWSDIGTPIVRYEYWRINKHSATESDINDLKAEVVTVMAW